MKRPIGEMLKPYDLLTISCPEQNQLLGGSNKKDELHIEDASVNSSRNPSDLE